MSDKKLSLVEVRHLALVAFIESRFRGTIYDNEDSTSTYADMYEAWGSNDEFQSAVQAFQAGWDASHVYATDNNNTRSRSMKGRAKWFNDAKGYGFLVVNGKDIFVHHTSIQMEGFRKLKEGAEYEFNLVDGPKGQQAADVRICDGQ